MLNVAPLSARQPLRTEPLTIDARERIPRLRIAGDGMTASAILDTIARLASTTAGTVDVTVDVTNAWSIPWTTQLVRLPAGPGGRRAREAYVRHKGFRWSEDRTEAVYEVAPRPLAA